MDLKELVVTSNIAEIALIKSLLDSEGISYLAQGEHFHAAHPIIEPVRFLVPQQDLERARPLLEALDLRYGSFADWNDTDGLQNQDP